MPFQNNVVAGTTLVRDSIHSPNYVTGVSGWTINKDGSVEFGSGLFRGDLFTGAAPNARVGLTVVTPAVGPSFPAVAFFDGTHTDPAYAFTDSDGTQATINLSTSQSNAVGNQGRQIRLETQGFFVSNEAGTMGFELFMDTNEKTYPGGTNQFVIVNAPAGILNSTFATTYPYLTDGKVFTGTPVTTTLAAGGAVGASSVITSGNASNVVVSVDQVYRASGVISCTGSVAADRGALELFEGGLGGTKRGGSVNWKVKATAGQLESQWFSFIWRATADTTITSLDLAITRVSGAGSLSAQVDGNYFILVEEMGHANKVGAL